MKECPSRRRTISRAFFKIVGSISDIETIASGSKVRERRRLREFYGGRRWKKLKGAAMVKLANDTMFVAELHWDEVHGVKRKELKIKRILEAQ